MMQEFNRLVNKRLLPFVALHLLEIVVIVFILSKLFG